MKHVSSSFRPSGFRAGGYLCIVILVALRLLACHGLLPAHLSERHVSGGTRSPRSVARKLSFQIKSSSASDHLRIEKSMLDVIRFLCSVLMIFNDKDFIIDVYLSCLNNKCFTKIEMNYWWSLCASGSSVARLHMTQLINSIEKYWKLLSLFT